MPTIKSLRHGMTAGVPPSSGHHKRAPRDKCNGWSASACRRNTCFLYGVDERHLTGAGYAITLTLKDCPPTSVEWHRLRRALFKRLDRTGMSRLHWVVEWQRRGVPHLHLCAYWPEGTQRPDTTGMWCDIASAYGAGQQSQFETPIYDISGWTQYVSKHASRGISNYQRSPECVPHGWRGVGTGRMWGHWGDWPQAPCVNLEIDNHGFHAYRRIVRKRSESIARADLEELRRRIAPGAIPGTVSCRASPLIRAAVRRLCWTRRRLQCPEQHLCTVRGWSEWIPQEQQDLIAAHLLASGYHLDHTDTAARRNATASVAAVHPGALPPSQYQPRSITHA